MARLVFSYIAFSTGGLAITIKRLLQTIAWEIIGLALLVAFVIGIATMPPLQIQPDTAATFGYHLTIDTAKWGEGARQYLALVSNGTLGTDRTGVPVSDLLWTKLGASLKLLFIATVIALVLGAVKGVWDFGQLRRGKIGLGPVITGIVQGLPDFWLVIMIQILIVQVVRHTGWRPFPPAYDDSQPIASLIAPLLCLALIPLAYVARITSTALTTVYDHEYIRTARAKGLAEGAVIYRHAVRSALVQIIDGLPNALAVMFSNLLIVEYMFRVPGVTILLKDSISPVLGLMADPRIKPPAPDVPVLVAAGVALGLIFAVIYLALSIIRRVVDPRLRERDQA